MNQLEIKISNKDDLTRTTKSNFSKKKINLKIKQKLRACLVIVFENCF